jgi:hypothetical protein
LQRLKPTQSPTPIASHRIAATHKPVRLNQQFCLQRPGIPDPGSDDVVQLIAVAERKPFRHRLNALAIARTDQTRHVERTHLSPHLMAQASQKRLESTLKLVSPIQRSVSHGRLSKSRPLMSHRKTDLKIPCLQESAKVVPANSLSRNAERTTKSAEIVVYVSDLIGAWRSRYINPEPNSVPDLR